MNDCNVILITWCSGYTWLLFLAYFHMLLSSDGIFFCDHLFRQEFHVTLTNVASIDKRFTILPGKSMASTVLKGCFSCGDDPALVREGGPFVYIKIIYSVQ